jgi:hypothetical protein
MVEGNERQTFAEFEPYINKVNDRSVLGALHGGNRIILGVRHVSDIKANGGLGEYDDQFVVMWYDGPVGKAMKFDGSTDPSGYYEDAGSGASSSGGAAVGADADGDGRLDIGRIASGVYLYRRGTSKKLGDRVLRPVNPVKIERDVNHDGVFDEQDAAAITDEGSTTAMDFLFYPGLENRTGSAGGQTMSPEVYDRFWDALGDQEEFIFVLTEA